MRIDYVEWVNEVVWDRKFPDSDEEVAHRLQVLAGRHPDIVTSWGDKPIPAFNEYLKGLVVMASRAGRAGVIREVIALDIFNDRDWSACWDMQRFDAKGLLTLASSGAPAGRKSSQPLLWAALCDETGATARELMALGHNPADPRYEQWGSAAIKQAPLMLALGFPAPAGEEGWIRLVADYLIAHRGDNADILPLAPTLTAEAYRTVLRTVMSQAKIRSGDDAPGYGAMFEWAASRLSQADLADALLWAASVPTHDPWLILGCYELHLKGRGAALAAAIASGESHTAEDSYEAKLLHCLVESIKAGDLLAEAAWEEGRNKRLMDPLVASLSAEQKERNAISAFERVRHEQSRYWLSRCDYSPRLLLSVLAIATKNDGAWRDATINWNEFVPLMIACRWLRDKAPPTVVAAVREAWQSQCGADSQLPGTLETGNTGREQAAPLVRAMMAALSLVDRHVLVEGVSLSREIRLLARYSPDVIEILPALPPALRVYAMDEMVQL